MGLIDGGVGGGGSSKGGGLGVARNFRASKLDQTQRIYSPTPFYPTVTPEFRGFWGLGWGVSFFGFPGSLLSGFGSIFGCPDSGFSRRRSPQTAMLQSLNPKPSHSFRGYLADKVACCLNLSCHDLGI